MADYPKTCRDSIHSAACSRADRYRSPVRIPSLGSIGIPIDFVLLGLTLLATLLGSSRCC
jgi:hypothetical protein